MADSATHGIICAVLSLSGTTDAQPLPALISQIHHKIKAVSADGAYGVCYCPDEEKSQALTPPHKGSSLLGIAEKYLYRLTATLSREWLSSVLVYSTKPDYTNQRKLKSENSDSQAKLRSEKICLLISWLSDNVFY